MRKSVLFLLSCSIVFAQDQKQQYIASEAAIPNLPAQIIGADDMILVSVYLSPEFTRTVRVSPDGDVRLPMLKQRVKAQGLLPSELEVAVGDALREEKLLVDPFVTVTVIEYHSRPVSVTGAVKKPITFQVIGRTTLLDAITRAEGLTPEAEGQILVSRPGADQKTALVQRIPVRELIDHADSEFNLRLVGGEEIRVPEAPKITVTGNVKKPGVFPVTESSELTVLKAVALAEGLSQYSANMAFILRPDDGKNTKSEIAIPLKKILARKSPDVPLMARDILYIPDSSGKRAFDKALSLGGQTASGLLIWH